MPDTLVICGITTEMRDRLSDGLDIAEIKELEDQEGWLNAHGEAISYVLTDGHIGMPSELLRALPNLKAISSYGVGYDAIDTGLTNRHSIPVSHTPSVLDEEVATTALMLYLSVMRGFVQHANHAGDGLWASEGGLPLTRSADDRKIGILGLGRIGKAIARKLEPFGAEISYCGRTQQDVPFKYFSSLMEMANYVDVLISAAPGGSGTHHLVNEIILTALGKTGVVVNVGRGSVVDESALISALKAGRIAGAGLDVFENEPHIPAELRTMPNVVVTPHIGSATVETRRAMGDLAVDNLLEFKTTGRMRTPVPESLHLFE